MEKIWSHEFTQEDWDEINRIRHLPVSEAMIPNYPMDSTYPSQAPVGNTGVSPGASGGYTTGHSVISGSSSQNISSGYYFSTTTNSFIGGTITFTTGGTQWMDIKVVPVKKKVDRSWKGEVCGLLKVTE